MPEDDFDWEFIVTIREEGERIEQESEMKFIEFAGQIGEGDQDRAGPIQVWKGIASALAHCSGLRVVLQAPVLVPSDDGETHTCVDYKDVCAQDPAIFVTPADWLL